MVSSKIISRKSTIMFTDIVGYSKMVEKDEKHAIKILNEHNQLIVDIISKFDGIVIKHIGDAIFAAIEFQNKFKERNRLCRKADQIIVSAGYHSITWNANNMANGLYFIKMSTEGYNQLQKVILFYNNLSRLIITFF